MIFKFVGALSSTGHEGALMPVTEPYIDAHCHVWTPDVHHYPLGPGFTVQDMNPRSFTAEELLAICRQAGVGRVNLIQMSYYEFDSWERQAWHDASLALSLYARCIIPHDAGQIGPPGQQELDHVHPIEVARLENAQEDEGFFYSSFGERAVT